MEQLTIFDSEAEIRRDDGIARAVKHANKQKPGWSETAYLQLRMFLITRTGKPFLAEEVRMYAESKGMPEPPSKRAWGAVMLRANRNKLIVACGYKQTSNPKAHKTPATLWRPL